MNSCLLQEDVELHWKDKENKADIVFCMEHLPVGSISIGVSLGIFLLNETPFSI